MEFWGHSQNAAGSGVPEPLKVHILAVARSAAEFAVAFGAHDQALMAGLLHDLGKYTPQFQQRVRGNGTGRDHASIGALAALYFYKKIQRSILPALAIEGHHAGLKTFHDSSTNYVRALTHAFNEASDRFTEINLDPPMEAFDADGLSLQPVRDGLIPNGTFTAANLFDARMLFSCLVDADFLETEAHFEGDSQTPRRPRPVGRALDFDLAIATLNKHIQRFDPPINELTRLRRQLFDACVEAAPQSPGLFTLTAPTGFGKTLAMLAFALHHAKAHGLRRIILVMPYLNIIEQTANIYRELFHADNGFAAHTVLEHHSLASDQEGANSADAKPHSADEQYADGKPSMQRLMSENWDAPVVLTTNVQLLESMMANKPSACRKLHRLAGSVILLDEAQTLPPALAKTTLATLSRLADPNGPYRASVLFATATQPAFDVLNSQVNPLASSGWQPREINPHQTSMFKIAASRVKVHWRHDKPLRLAQLASELSDHQQVLAIVNLKRHATALTNLLQEQHKCEGLVHLSTNMCPAHRMSVLKLVRQRINNGLPIRLISTQCIEAGVDISLPVVYRALAPLDAISQAAGRCNRHGELEQPGQFHVVQIDDDGKKTWPPGYEAGIRATQGWLTAMGHDASLDAQELLNDPARINAYYQKFYGSTQRDQYVLPDEQALHQAMIQGQFSEVAKQYKLIDSNTISIVVPYCMEIYQQLADQAEGGMDDAQARREWRRKASHHAVSIYRPAVWNSLAAVQFHPREEPVNETSEWFILKDPDQYHPQLGLQLLEDKWIV